MVSIYIYIYRDMCIYIMCKYTHISGRDCVNILCQCQKPNRLRDIRVCSVNDVSVPCWPCRANCLVNLSVSALSAARDVPDIPCQTCQLQLGWLAAGWLAGCPLAGWLAGWLVGWLAGWLAALPSCVRSAKPCKLCFVNRVNVSCRAICFV